MILKESMNYVKGLSDEVDGFKDEAKDFRAEIVKISTELLETIDKSEIFSLINEEEKSEERERRSRELIEKPWVVETVKVYWSESLWSCIPK